MFVSKRFFGDQHGNTTILFSLAFVGLLGITGLAIDYSRATAARARIAAAADTSVLAGAKDGATLAERKALAQQYFNAAIANIPGTSNVNMTPEDVVLGGKVVGFKVSGTVRLETMFGSLHGTPHFDVGFLA